MFKHEETLKKPYINYISRYRKGLKPVTLVIGARCKDGVVLVGDRKVTGALERYTNKIRMASPFNDAVYGAAGIETLFEEFLDQLPKNVLLGHNYFEERNKELVDNLKTYYTVRDFKHDCVNLLKQMKNVYSEIPHEESLQVLIAVQDHIKKRASLYFLDLDNCFPAEVKDFLPIGMGHLSIPFLKAYRKEMTMKQAAMLFSFIIKYIEKEELEESIGVGKLEPQIFFIPDEGEVLEIKDIELQNMIKRVDKRVKKVKKEIGSSCTFFSS